MECDPSIKSIILKIDAEENAYIVEDLDEQHLVVKETMLNLLKQRLQEVSTVPYRERAKLTRHSISRQRLKSQCSLPLSRSLWLRRG